MASGNSIRKRFDHHQDFRMFNISVAMGRVPGWETFRKFGMNDTTAEGDEMWPLAGPRVLPPTAGPVTLVSDNAADTLTTGTGMWTARVYGLDDQYREITEDIDMNGLTPVVSAKNFFRLNRIYSIKAGSTEINVGNITATIGGTNQGYIEALEGQTHQVLYTIPVGKSLIITAYRLGVGRMGGADDFHVKGQVRLFGANNSWRTISDIYLYNGETYSSGEGGITVLPEKTELRMRIGTNANTQAFGVVAGMLVQNKYL